MKKIRGKWKAGFSFLLISLCSLAAHAQDGVIQIPSGTYELDPAHAMLQWSIVHLGLSNYHVRFTDFDVILELDSEHVENSSVQVNINPSALFTGYTLDYKATHPGSEFDNWETALANDENFLNADTYPTITYQSTGIESLGEGNFQVTGDLTLFGQTHPVSLRVSLVGQAEKSLATQKPAIGFHAEGLIDRTIFGSNVGVGPLSSEVQLTFDGELHYRGE